MPLQRAVSDDAPQLMLPPLAAQRPACISQQLTPCTIAGSLEGNARMCHMPPSLRPCSISCAQPLQHIGLPRTSR
jgi:hypothetical protein